jgi:amino acid transporter
MLGSSRLGYAMAAHGLLPKALGDVHPRYHTPHVALAVQCGFAVALTFVDRLPELITFAVFNLAFSFFLCSLSAMRLQRLESGELGKTQRLLPFAALVITGGLLLATSLTNKLIGAGVLTAGLVVYFAVGPGEIIAPAMSRLTNVEHQLDLLARRRMRFLGGPLGWLGGHRSPNGR